MTDVSSWMLAASVDDVEPGHGFESDVEIDGEIVGLFCVNGEYFALGECSHEQGPLSQGHVNGGEVTCPWHSAIFDIRTGACIAGPSACRIEGNVAEEDDAGAKEGEECSVFDVKVEGNDIYVRRSS